VYQDEPRAVLSALLEEDETIVDIDPAGDRLVDRVALILVRNGIPESLPKAATDLATVVVEAASSYRRPGTSTQKLIVEPSVEPKQPDSGIPATRKITFQSTDILLGGEAHKAALLNLLKKARERVIIHSTFISQLTLNEVLPTISDAARRGVRVDILWGQDDEKSEAESTKKLISKLRKDIMDKGTDSLIVVHPFSTHSHAKILIADDGQTGRIVAV
ncbi:MAG: phospholipase D-like domain-containing protein, partial [Coleofasciculus sp. C2-GNP5-27]